MTHPRITVLPDSNAIAAEAAGRIIGAARHAVAQRGRFSIALSGGSTPKTLYGLLAAEPLVSQMPWDKTDLYFGDERCVPPDHKDSNFRMATEALLSKAPIPPGNVHRMRGEIDPNEAAKAYGLLLKEKLGAGGIDVVLLGMGDDGHTASLFPHTEALKETEHRVVANYAEFSTTGKSWRITFTAPFINKARVVMFLIAGASKAARLVEVIHGPRDPHRLPSQLINPAGGELQLLLDKAAAEKLP